jgi:RimJ/RimL family protein N-acetyltransferase
VADEAGADDLREHLALTDGRRVLLRAIAAEDDAAYRLFAQGLSAASVYYRFFSPRRTLSEQEIDHFLHVDQVDRYATVAVDEDTGAIVGVGRYDRLVDAAEAEVAFVVADDYQNEGIATAMLRLLGRAARHAGISRLVAAVLPDNLKMLAVFHASDWREQRRFEDGVIQIDLDLDEVAGGAAGGS